MNYNLTNITKLLEKLFKAGFNTETSCRAVRSIQGNN